MPAAPTTSATTTHDSDDVFALGNKLIERIEAQLEGVLTNSVTWRHAYHRARKRLNPASDLHAIFQLHSRYIQLNLARQKNLITDMDVTSRSFVISEISVIESQKQTIEQLMGAYAAAVFADQNELASFKAGMIAIVGVIVAIAAFILTDFRFQSLLK